MTLLVIGDVCCDVGQFMSLKSTAVGEAKNGCCCAYNGILKKLGVIRPGENGNEGCNEVWNGTCCLVKDADEAVGCLEDPPESVALMR